MRKVCAWNFFLWYICILTFKTLTLPQPPLSSPRPKPPFRKISGSAHIKSRYNQMWIHLKIFTLKIWKTQPTMVPTNKYRKSVWLFWQASIFLLFAIMSESWKISSRKFDTNPMGILIQISFSNCDHKDPMFQYIHVENRKRGIWGYMICKNEYLFGIVLLLRRQNRNWQFGLW